MENQFERNIWAIGQAKQDMLATMKVLVVGIGGVGGAAIELLVRAGIGEIHLCDPETVTISNINRQLIANHSTIGKLKVDLWEKRIKEINPNCKVVKHAVRYSQETRDEILDPGLDYVIDAFDQYKEKADIVCACSKLKIKSIHAMGAANRVDPTKFVVTRLDKVKSDFLAQGMKKILKKWNKDMSKIWVVASTEEPIRQTPPSSLSFTPMAAGNLLAHFVFTRLTE